MRRVGALRRGRTDAACRGSGVSCRAARRTAALQSRPRGQLPRGPRAARRSGARSIPAAAAAADTAMPDTDPTPFRSCRTICIRTSASALIRQGARGVWEGDRCSGPRAGTIDYCTLRSKQGGRSGGLFEAPVPPFLYRVPFTPSPWCGDERSPSLHAHTHVHKHACTRPSTMHTHSC